MKELTGLFFEQIDIDEIFYLNEYWYIKTNHNEAIEVNNYKRSLFENNLISDKLNLTYPTTVVKIVNSNQLVYTTREMNKELLVTNTQIFLEEGEIEDDKSARIFADRVSINHGNRLVKVIYNWRKQIKEELRTLAKFHNPTFTVRFLYQELVYSTQVVSMPIEIVELETNTFKLLIVEKKRIIKPA